MNCANCGEPIAQCELGTPIEDPPCWYHTGHGFHRCDGLMEQERLAETVLIATPKVTS